MTYDIPTPPDPLASELRFLAGGGKATSLILARDWSNHPLGEPAGWPDILKSTLSMILNSTESLILAWGRDELVFFFNECYFPILGPRLSWAMGAPFREVWPDAWEQAKPIIDDAFGGHSQRFRDLPWKLDTDRGPADTWFTFSYSRVLDPQGEIAGLFVLTNETTEHVLADAALKRSQAAARLDAERVQLALGAGAIVGTWFWDISTDKFTADDSFSRAFGLDPALSKEGIPIADVVATVHPDDQEELARAIGAAIVKGGPYSHQYRVLRADGNYHWIEANGRVEHAPDGTPLSFPGVLIDLKERRAIEGERDSAIAALRTLNETLEQRVSERTTELMQAEEQLRQAQKMEAVGQLTGGLAHDFNNLLTGVMGNLELLQFQMARGRVQDIDRYVGAAREAGRRAAALTQRLLAFSRRQTLDPKPTDVTALIAGLADLLRRTVGATAQINIIDMAELWIANIDAGQLENALINLCINARDAMPDGGRITIETANIQLDEATARGHELAAGEFLSICVADTGCGMSPETLRRAFEPFYTTKPTGQGTGLGLSMIYGFARQSGGQVHIASEVGHGTRVSLLLPRHIGAVDQPESVHETGDVQAAAGQTILVVDDEPSIRQLVHEFLGDAGYRVLAAVDGPSALKLLESGMHIQLLITDVGLPGGMNGRQLADAARALVPGLKVLLITGYAESVAVRNGHLEPGMELLTKPFSMQSLSMKVAEMIQYIH